MGSHIKLVLDLISLQLSFPVLETEMYDTGNTGNNVSPQKKERKIQGDNFNF